MESQRVGQDSTHTYTHTPIYIYHHLSFQYNKDIVIINNKLENVVEHIFAGPLRFPSDFCSW